MLFMKKLGGTPGGVWSDGKWNFFYGEHVERWSLGKPNVEKPDPRAFVCVHMCVLTCVCMCTSVCLWWTLNHSTGRLIMSCKNFSQDSPKP